MNKGEFEKVWNLYRGLFPGHHSLENKNIRAVWEVALLPYALDEVVASSMAYARRNKYFPNVAEITGKLEPVEPLPELPKAEKAAGCAWMAPYIRKLADRDAEAHAEELHAAGLMTWSEAEAAGRDFGEWSLEYRERFPVRMAGEEDK